MIQSRSDPRWIAVALKGFDELLIDHAHCEKKAAATALSLLASYPERDDLVRSMSALAIEELRHFRAVYEKIRARGLALARDPGNPYARALLDQMRQPSEERMLDRLLVAGLIEARSHERLSLLADALTEPELARFYTTLARAETGHAELFLKLARSCAEPEQADARLSELARVEAEILASLPIQPRIH